MNIKIFPLLISVFICAGVHAAGSDRDMAQETVGLYEQALEQYGIAMGEREAGKADEKSPVSKLLLRQVAEVICLLGNNVQGCLDASVQAGRSVGVYCSPLGPGEISLRNSYDASRQFLLELHKNSKDWGMDESVASEALAYLLRIQADAGRQKLKADLGPELKKILARASSVKDYLHAFRLAKKIMDQDAVVKTGLSLTHLLVSGRGNSLDEPTTKSVSSALRLTRDTMKILGLTESPSFVLVKTQCEKFEIKELAVPGLDFHLVQSPARFHGDLLTAQKQLAMLGKKAPLRSRASVLFTYLASYIGVMMQQAGAGRPLRPILETLSMTDPWMAGRALGLLGRDAMEEGDFWAAAGLLKRSETSLKAFSDASVLRGLAMAKGAQAWFYLGQYARAALGFSKAAETFKGATLLRAKAIAGRVHSLVFARRLDGVAQLLDEAHELIAGLTTRQSRILSAKLKLERALFLLASAERDRAIELFEQVAKLKSDRTSVEKAAPVKKVVSIALTNLAELMNDSGKYSRALSLSESALDLLNPFGQADALWQAFCEKGRALDGLGSKKKAEKAFDRSMDIVESLRSKVGAEGARRSFAAGKKRLYSQTVSSLMSSGAVSKAFLVSERARGRAFLDMLGERQIELGNSAVNNKFKTARMSMLGALPPLSLDFQEPASIRFEKPAGTNHDKTHGGSFSAKTDPSKAWLSLVSVNPASVKDVQHVLRPGEGLVSFFHDGSRLEIFLVTADGLDFGSVDVSAPMLSRRSEDLLRKLKRPDDDDSKVKRKAKKLWELTFAPISKRLTKLNSLIIVPWGPLHYIPFGALYDGQNYAVDRWQMAVIPSSSALMMIRASGTYSKKLLHPGVFALGNPATDLKPLPAAQQEADMLGRLFAGAIVRTGQRATRSSVFTEAVKATIIHLASHGVFFPKRPMDSYLALSGKDSRGARLRAFDILGLDLSHARLVVLSACSSGKVTVADGEEIVGLTRAFLHAGTPSLVASLWPISDSASMKFVGIFYRAIKKGFSPRAALSSAERALKSRPEFSHPFFWAPFELVGS